MKRLGRNGPLISSLALGTYELRLSSPQTAQRILSTALDLGMNCIDTAPCYGRSEALIGQAISARRQDFVLISKCGCDMDSQSPGHPVRYTRENIAKNLENSLRLLRTDYLDVWLLHGARPEDIQRGRADDVIAAMKEYQAQGKVRQIGVSMRNGGKGDLLFPAGYSRQGLLEYTQWNTFNVFQIVYGALTHTAEDVLEQAAQTGVGLIARGSLRFYREDYASIVEKAKLFELFDEEETLQSFLIRFTLSNHNITAPLVGTQNADHLIANKRAADRGPLAQDVYQEARRRLSYDDSDE